MNVFKKILKMSAIVALIAFALYMTAMFLRLDERLTFGKIEQITEAPFYDTSEFTVKTLLPGELLRSEKLMSAPAGSTGWRVIYRSTDKDGTPLPIIAWSHPTTGVAKRCAPSSGFDPFDSIEGLRGLLNAGYTVVAADYSNMGVDGPPSFLIGDSEARTVLDIVRSASYVPEVPSTNEVVFWGHSQGGHASLFASQVVGSYAPEITMKGVALAAPATNLQELIKSDIDKMSGVTIGSYAFNEYSKAYGANLDTILSVPAQQTVQSASDLCLLGQNAQLHNLTKPLIGNFLVADPAVAQPWASLLSLNTPTGPPVSTPLFIAQGQKDELINPSITRNFADTQRLRGVKVTYVSLPNAGHGLVAVEAVPDLLKWLAEINN